MHPITIIGSGLAGYTLAREIRKLDKETPIRIITADNGSFYSKPMLSNAFAKNQTAAQLEMNSAAEMAEKNNLQIINNCQVSKIDSEKKNIFTTDGNYEYSSLVFATGANPIRIPVEGDGAGDILSVNSLDDYAVFREQLEGKNSVAILGAGLIGCEFANDLAAAGFHVDLIDLADQPLGRLLPKKAAENLKQHLSELDITWHLGCSLKQVNKAASGYSLMLSDGSTLNSELVLSAIGLKPKTELAATAKIDINRGIVVNHYMQSSNESIYAIGDCAEINAMVMPYVMPIMIGARALAQTLTGNKTFVEFPAMPVVVKTPAHPAVVCPPAPNASGEWKEEVIGNGIKATFHNGDSLLGFALTGDAVSEKQALTKQIAIK